MMESEGHFNSYDGVELFERRWTPDGACRADLVLLHGYGEHCARYAHVAQAMNRAGIGVYTYDQRGFGRSPGKRAYIRDFDTCLRDLDAYLAYIVPHLTDKPRFFLGHSMGGLVLARYVETRPVDARGLIFSSPFLAFNDDVPRLLLAFANVLGRIAPWLPVAAVDNTGLSRDPEIVEAADSDPLSFHGRIAARTGAQFNAAITQAQAHLDAVTAPVYIIHGADDRIVPKTGSQLLHDRCRSADKTLMIYDGGYHELWNDLEKETVIAGMCDWIITRC